MNGPFKAFKIIDDVYWVGAIDWKIRNFHGYLTSRGTTYNAYLVLADRITLIDTVKAPFKDEMMSRISSVIDPEKIEIIISNHSEMDHSGSLMETIKAVKPAEVCASKMGVRALSSHFDTGDRIKSVNNSQELSLGNMNVTFLETRMLHWPDSMVSYLREKKLLFSQDIFGMHLATYERFDNQLDFSLLKAEATKYYANIILPFSPIVKKQLAELKKMNLDLDMVAPDHGPIWTSHFGDVLHLYSIWADQKPTDKAVIVYDTMWNSTELMARAIAEGLSANGARVKVMPLQVSHRSDVATEILEAGALIVGAPTINNQIFPSLGDVLTYLKGLKRQNLIGGVFGSYGWGGQSTGILKSWLEEMNVEIVTDEVRINYVPGPDDLERCYRMGAEIAGKLTGIKTPAWIGGGEQ